MARKKKTAEVKTPKTYLDYTGVVTASVMKGKKVYSTKTFKNEGRWPLFYFLNCCLAGDYITADSYRPKFINLFYYQSSSQTPPDITQDGQNLSTIFGDRRTLTSIPYMSQAKVTLDKSTPNNVGNSKITYKFTIPFVQLNITSTSTGGVNLIALYGNFNVDQPANPSAYLFIKDKNGNLSDLIEGDPKTYSNDFNLYIEWTLYIGNHTTTN